jgi:hypothetical protein
MIDKNTISLEDARSRLEGQIKKTCPAMYPVGFIIDEAEDIGKLMAKSPEMERAVIGYLLAVRKQEEK